MKILHLETGMHLYGGARQVLYLIEGLERRGVDNVLVCAKASAVANAGRESCAVIELKMRGDLDLPFVGRFFRLIKQQQPDIIHIHSRRGADTLGGLAARWAGTPAVLTRRVDNPESSLGVRLKYPLFRQVVAISGYIEHGLREAGIDERKLSCVPSAVDSTLFCQRDCEDTWLREEFGVSPGEPILAVVAQLIRRKGHEFVIRAMQGIVQRFPSATMLLLGRGPLEDSLRKQIAQAGLAERVQLVGFRDDLHRVLACVDVLVHPALAEGLGVALLQAASAGVAIVASDAGGIPEIVEHERTGLLVARGDSEALAQAVCRLLADSELRASLGRTARAKVLEEFSIDRMTEGNLGVYQSMLRRATETADG